MYDDNDKNSFMEALQTAKNIDGAINAAKALKAGKSLAGAAKGAATFGPYGAAVGFLIENRNTIKKALPIILFILFLPIVFMLMLPSIVFGNLTDAFNTAFNNETEILKNLEKAKTAVHEVLLEDYHAMRAELEQKIINLPEGTVGAIESSFNEYSYVDSLLIISQYCVYEDHFEKINVANLKSTLKKASGNLFSYTEETVKEKNEDETETTKIIYTINFVGDDYFASNVFNLDENQREIANAYAQNLYLFLYGTNFTTSGGSANVSVEVEQYTELIKKYAEKYGIPEYVELLKAVMMQESGGRSVDVMQSSECAYNTNFPKRPNGITDTEYSIDCGVHYFADALKAAGCTSPSDLKKVSLALQGYNFGLGYISWALENYGGYSESNAVEFSNIMKARMGWSRYGDVLYVSHVLRYYSFGETGGQQGWGSPFVGKDWRKSVTSEFSYRTDPINGKRLYHDGLDIAYGKGTPINAVKGGKILVASDTGNGFGIHIVIDHGDGTTALYGHCSKALVTVGQTVATGHAIAEVGSTGRSTGNHLHLTIKENGTAVNPRNYIR